MTERVYVKHAVVDRYSGGMKWDVQDGNVDAAARALTHYLRRNDPNRPISLYEEREECRVTFRELPDPDEAPA